MNAILETPNALVEAGRIHCGFFRRPFRTVNLLDAHQPGPVLGRAFRRLRLKEWVGFGINHPQLFGGILIQNSGYAASGVFYLYHRDTQAHSEWLIVDWPAHVKLPETLWKGGCRCGADKRHITFTHDLEHFQHRIEAVMPARGGNPALRAELTLHQDWREIDPLVVSLPIPPHHHTYTHKSPVRIEGCITVGDREYIFDPERDWGNLDEQKTYYPYRSRWHWGCFVGRSMEGHDVMLNLVDQMTEKGAPAEDALWVDGHLHLLQPAAFIAGGADGVFNLVDKASQIDLHFTAEGAKKEKRNYLAVAMDYKQYYGCYQGCVTDNEGRVHTIQNLFGALEQMRARF